MRAPDRILRGTRFDDQIVPAPDGSFLFELSTGTLSHGRFVVRAETHEGVRANGKLRIVKRKQFGPKVPRSELDKPSHAGQVDIRPRREDEPPAGQGRPPLLALSIPEVRNANIDLAETYTNELLPGE